MRKVKDMIVCVVVLAVAAVGIFLLSKLDSKSDYDTDNVYVPSTSTTDGTKPNQNKADSVEKVALPDTIYGIVGKPIIIRYLNITGYNSLDEISVVVDAAGKGVTYDDRWEYTPTEAGDTVVSFTVSDKQGVVINKSTHTLRIADSQKSKEVSVLVIGDGTIAVGYETKQMLDMAELDGNKLTLLGTGTANHGNDDNNRFEGRSGWRASTYVSNMNGSDSDVTNPFYNPEAKRFDFSYYMLNQGYSSVDVVFIQLGISEIFGEPTDEMLYSENYMHKYFRYMDKIIESIHVYDPNIKIVWNLILPGSTEEEKFEMAYGKSQTAAQYKRNTYLTNLEIVNNKSNTTNVYLAPTNAPLDTVHDMQEGIGGGVHPGAKGCQDIGAALYGMIMAIVE